jgi:hypothetical protein
MARVSSGKRQRQPVAPGTVSTLELLNRVTRFGGPRSQTPIAASGDRGPSSRIDGIVASIIGVSRAVAAGNAPLAQILFV